MNKKGFAWLSIPGIILIVLGGLFVVSIIGGLALGAVLGQIPWWAWLIIIVIFIKMLGRGGK